MNIPQSLAKVVLDGVVVPRVLPEVVACAGGRGAHGETDAGADGIGSAAGQVRKIRLCIVPVCV